VTTISDLYNKRVISLDGKVLGEVKGVMLNMEDGTVSHILLDDINNLIRSNNVRTDFIKHSISFTRVKKIAETIVVSGHETTEKS
jgi:sporulation protein YlmC with PRC-barrel domain